MLDDDYEHWWPVRAHVFQFLINSLAFGGCVLWLTLLSNEVSAVLLAISNIEGISGLTMGLTVLSFSNSMPDWASGVSMCRAGFSDVALASVYGSSLLSTLVGLAATFISACAKEYPEPLDIPVSTGTVLAWGWSVAMLLLHMAVFKWSNYSPPKWFGPVLIGLYAAYVACVLLTETRLIF